MFIRKIILHKSGIIIATHLEVDLLLVSPTILGSFILSNFWLDGGARTFYVSQIVIQIPSYGLTFKKISEF